MVWGTAIKIIGPAIKTVASKLFKTSRKISKPRTQAPPQAAIGVSKESQTIGARAINHYNDILKQIPDGPVKEKLLAALDKEAWTRTGLPQRERLDKAIQALINQKINIRRGINSRGITEISQIKPYGYWAVRLPHGEMKFGFSYPALLKLSEKLTPIQKSRFLSALEEALRLPQKPGGSSKIVDSIKLTSNEAKHRKEIAVILGDLKLEGFMWKDGVYTIDAIYKRNLHQIYDKL